MTHYEFNRILGSINTLSPEQARLLRRELDGKLAASEITPVAADPRRAETADRMKQVFADAQYWVALLNDQDQGHAAARAAMVRWKSNWNN